MGNRYTSVTTANRPFAKMYILILCIVGLGSAVVSVWLGYNRATFLCLFRFIYVVSPKQMACVLIQMSYIHLEETYTVSRANNIQGLLFLLASFFIIWNSLLVLAVNDALFYTYCSRQLNYFQRPYFSNLCMFTKVVALLFNLSVNSSLSRARVCKDSHTRTHIRTQISVPLSFAALEEIKKKRFSGIFGRRAENHPPPRMGGGYYPQSELYNLLLQI